MTQVQKRRHTFRSRRSYTGLAPLPDRKYRAHSCSKGREEWYANYDIIGHRAVGSMFKGPELIRRIFNVRFDCGMFEVDIGTGNGVKIKFEH